MSGNCRSIFRNLLSFSEIRIRNYFVLCNLGCCTLFVVMDYVTDCILSPMSIEGNVFFNWFIPVIRRTSFVSSSEPTLEGIVSFCRVRWFCCIESIFICLGIICTTLAVCFCVSFSPCSTLHVKCYSTCWELEISIKHKTCRHLCILIIGVRILVFCISKPT